MSSVPAAPLKKCLPDERDSKTRKITIHGESTSLEMYVTVSFYPGTDEPAEVFIKTSKKGSTLQGFASAWARMVSMALHRGVSWEDVREKFAGIGFEPRGETHSDLGNVGSPLDAVIRFVEAVRFQRQQVKKGFGPA